jgi:RNase P protein component
MSDPAKLSPTLRALLQQLERDRVKRRLKAAFQRKPKPARTKPQDEDTP